MDVDFEQLERAKPITDRRTADAVTAKGCQVAGCKHEHANEPLYLHGRCHPSAAVEVAYYHGSVYVLCARCHSFIVRFLVGEVQ